MTISWSLNFFHVRSSQILKTLSFSKNFRFRSVRIEFFATFLRRRESNESPKISRRLPKLIEITSVLPMETQVALRRSPVRREPSPKMSPDLSIRAYSLLAFLKDTQPEVKM